MTRLLNLFLLLLSFFLTLLLAEMGLRIFAPQIIDCKINYEWRLDDPVLPYIPKPNYRGRMKVKNQFDVTLSTNTQGFRGINDVAISRTAGIQRLLFMGDSFPFGWGVDDEDAYPHQVGVILENSLGHSVEIVNASVYGFNIVEYGEWFNRVKKYMPDVFILGFTLENDFNITKIKTSVNENEILVERTNRLGYRLKEFINRLHIVTLVRDRFYINFPAIRSFMFAIGINHKRDIFLKKYTKSLRSSLQETSVILGKMRDEIKKNNSRFIVVLIPLREQVCCSDEINKFSGYDNERPNQALKEILNGLSIEHIDLLPAFIEENKKIKEKFYFDTDPHWTTAGHAVAARTIADYLLKRSFASPGSSFVPIGQDAGGENG